MLESYGMIILQLLGALGLLVFGMRMMSDALQKMAGSQLRNILRQMTTNRFTGMLTGTFVTCAVQSSSATTVMTVSFVSAGLLTLAEAISVIMGANIGTTLTAWIMSLGYTVDLTVVVYPAFFIGMLLLYSKRNRYVGDFLFGVAFLFFSLVLLSSAGKALDLEHNPAVVDFFASFDTGSYLTIIAFLLIGTIITCVVQSSAAVMAITILLCSTGVLPIHLGIALVMGENIGTTATANLAALGAGTRARQAALAHLVFNVFGVIWVLCVFFPFVDVVCQLAGYDPQAGGQATRLPVVLATFHTCFNVANTALLIGFIPQLERLVCWLLPEKEQEKAEEFRLEYIEANLIQTPEIAVMQAQKETSRFSDDVTAMFGVVQKLFQEEHEEHFEELVQQIERAEDNSDRMEVEIARYLGKVSDGHLSDNAKTKVRMMLREIGELESVGDACYNFTNIVRRYRDGKERFNPTQQQNLLKMMCLCQNALDQMGVMMHGPAREEDMKKTYRIEHQINHLRDQLKAENLKAVDNHDYDYTLGSMYNDMVGELEKLGDYIVNVVEARYGK